MNLLQNDSWLVHLLYHPEFQRQFSKELPTDDRLINAYETFINQIPSEYPQAHIICALGNIDASKQRIKVEKFGRDSDS